MTACTRSRISSLKRGRRSRCFACCVFQFPVFETFPGDARGRHENVERYVTGMESLQLCAPASIWNRPGPRRVNITATIGAHDISILRHARSGMSGNCWVCRLATSSRASSSRSAAARSVGACAMRRGGDILPIADVGRMTLDCDTVIIAADDLRIMIYTAESGSKDAQLLELAVILGTQTMVG